MATLFLGRQRQKHGRVLFKSAVFIAPMTVCDPVAIRTYGLDVYFKGSKEFRLMIGVCLNCFWLRPLPIPSLFCTGLADFSYEYARDLERFYVEDKRCVMLHPDGHHLPKKGEHVQLLATCMKQTVHSRNVEQVINLGPPQAPRSPFLIALRLEKPAAPPPSKL